MHLTILSSRGTLVNFSLLFAGYTGAKGRLVLPIQYGPDILSAMGPVRKTDF